MYQKDATPATGPCDRPALPSRQLMDHPMATMPVMSEHVTTDKDATWGSNYSISQNRKDSNSSLASSVTLHAIEHEHKSQHAQTAREEVSLQDQAQPQTSRLLSLAPELRAQALRCVLVRSAYITPYYNCGSVEVETGIAEKENFDASVLLVNKQLSEEATRILYGGNGFEFTSPEVASWWFKRIGRNFKDLKCVKLTLSTGFNGFGVSQERMWHNVILWMRLKHRFEELHISFKYWSDGYSNTYNRLDVSEMQRELATKERENIWSTLGKYRDIDRVTIDPGFFTSRIDADSLAWRMKRKTEVILPPKQSLSHGVSLVQERSGKRVSHTLQRRGLKYNRVKCMKEGAERMLRQVEVVGLGSIRSGSLKGDD